MNTYKIALKYFAIITVIFIGFISCDKDFASLESDIINRDNATDFNTDSEAYNVISYTDVLAPVQTNGLPYNFLGFYDDPYYGSTTASIVTQVSSSLLDPTFADDVNDVVLDSVVLTIPYFSTNVGLTEDNLPEYRLDSIFPRNTEDQYASINLSIFENNYFLRDFDPNESFDSPQAYYSNRSLSSSEMIADQNLENTLIHEEMPLIISDQAIELWDEDGEVTQILPPSIRLKLDTAYWKEKIINQQGTSVLSNRNNFNNYFRGLYFKADAINNNGSLIGLNLAATTANVTIYYRDTSSESTQSTYVLTFGGNRVSFFENNFITPISQGDENNGDSQLFLKGGQGAVAGIKLFDGLDQNNMPVFDKFKDDFANYDEDGDFESSKRLINEANLVFYVDQTEIQSVSVDGQEPNRLYLYDMDNNRPLIDYFFDITSSSFPAFSKPNHLGILQRVDGEPDGLGIKYKMKITEHIKNLVQNDSTNVTLGLAVSGNVNLEETFTQRMVQTGNDSEKRTPVSSIISPRGIVLHGNNSEDESKKLFLEIFYTCIEECEEN